MTFEESCAHVFVLGPVYHLTVYVDVPPVHDPVRVILCPLSIAGETGPSTNTCAQDSSNVIATYSGLSSTSNSISVSPTTTNGYCIGVTDSANTPVTVNSVVDVVTVNPALGVPTVAPSSPSIDNGQSITLTSTASGGGYAILLSMVYRNARRHKLSDKRSHFTELLSTNNVNDLILCYSYR